MFTALPVGYLHGAQSLNGPPRDVLLDKGLHKGLHNILLQRSCQGPLRACENCRRVVKERGEILNTRRRATEGQQTIFEQRYGFVIEEGETF
jgi:hypothetical protein